MVVGDGRKTSFWIDAWCSQHPLKIRFLDLFEIYEQQYIKVLVFTGIRGIGDG
jgi:hypothetical protein